MSGLGRSLYRLAVVWVVEGLTIWIAAALLSGMTLVGTGPWERLQVAMAVALVLAAMNIVVRPIVMLLTLPLNMITFGLFTLLVNALVLRLVSAVLPEFKLEGYFAAVTATIVLAAVNTVILRVLSVSDEESFFDGVSEWLSRRLGPGQDETHGEGLGIIMLEIDGLSYDRVLRAADDGIMPTVAAMLSDGSYDVSLTDCGVPSQTSSCQAGILHGDNHDIPAFRWYDKRQGKMIVSNNMRDAADLDTRLSSGQGLLRGGSSINNLASGDAAKALLTMSRLTKRPEGESQRAAEDLFLYWLYPSLFTRSLVLTAWDLVVELYQGFRQRVRDEQPRINRLGKGYPFLRALTNVFLRDLSTFMVSVDCIRGSPAIYTTFLGYDEVAHHAGPDTGDAMGTLRGLDASIRRVLHTIENKAPRPYELYVLSDHGQSAGATFEQRYDVTLQELLEELTMAEVAMHLSGGEGKEDYAATLVSELRNAVEHSGGGRLRRAVMHGTGRAIESSVPPAVEADTEGMGGAVIACVSGNFANIYFDLSTEKVVLGELNATYPQLVDALVEHAGIGFVVAYDEGAPVVLGRSGARDLPTGVVTGEDPLLPYGDPELRAMQVLRVANFPSSGDLIVNSTVFPDGSVCAFEELVGSHGGLGGPQTDAFVLHPSHVAFEPTTNSMQVFDQLNARRGQPPRPEPPPPPPVPEARVWSPKNLRSGIHDFGTWLPRLGHALLLDRATYRDLAADAAATGPALLVVLLMSAVLATFGSGDAAESSAAWPLRALADAASWLVGAVVVFVGGRLLGSKQPFSALFRTYGFARVVRLAGLLRLLVPALGPLFVLFEGLLAIAAAWLAISEGMQLKGWRVVAAALLGLGALVVSVLAVGLMLGGLELTLQAVLQDIGVAPR